MQNYIASWCAEVSLDGYTRINGAAKYAPSYAPTWVAYLGGVASSLVANIDRTSTGGAVLPEANPAGSTIQTASGWQYAQNYGLSVPTSVAAGGNLQVDLDTWTPTASTSQAVMVASSVTGQPYTTVDDYYNGGVLIGQTFLNGDSSTYLSDVVATLANGEMTMVFDGGSALASQPYSSFTDEYNNGSYVGAIYDYLAAPGLPYTNSTVSLNGAGR